MAWLAAILNVGPANIETLTDALLEAIFDFRAQEIPRLLADFHIVLARMLGNQVLEQMLSELLTRSSLIALMRQSSQLAEESHGEHVAIVDAFERRDVKTAVRLVDKHLGNVQRNLNMDPQRVDLADILQP